METNTRKSRSKTQPFLSSGSGSFESSLKDEKYEQQLS